MQVDWLRLHGNHPADRLTDFSYAGYRSSQVPLPYDAPPDAVILPLPNPAQDRTAEIQAAIDRLPPQGGTLFFPAGLYALSSAPITIARSNVILRGETGTVFKVQGPARTVITLGHAEPSRPTVKNRANITDVYLGAGATVIKTDKPNQFKVGQEVAVERFATAEWIAKNNMDKLERNGQPQTWIKPGTRLQEMRRVTAVQGDTVHIDIPLTDSIDTQLKQDGKLGIYAPPPEGCGEIGLACIHFVCIPSQCCLPIAEKNVHQPIRITSYTYDSWLRNVSFEGFLSSIDVAAQARRLTIQDCTFRRNAPSNRANGYTADVSLSGTQVLVLRCQVLGERGTESIGVCVQARVAGPNAVVGFRSQFSGVQTHARWSSGLLIDGCDVAAIELADRGIMGSGHGWTTTNSVVWNSTSRKLVCSKPPSGQNFAVGCVSKDVRKTDGCVVSKDKPVFPMGLFATQLAQRVQVPLAEAVLRMSLSDVPPPPVPHARRPA